MRTDPLRRRLWVGVLATVLYLPGLAVALLYTMAAVLPAEPCQPGTAPSGCGPGAVQLLVAGLAMLAVSATAVTVCWVPRVPLGGRLSVLLLGLLSVGLFVGWVG